MKMFQQNADGLVFVRTEVATYVDAAANFEADFGQSIPDFPAGATGRVYEPGVRHAIMDTSGVIAGGPMPWQFGEDAMAAIMELIAAQVKRTTGGD